MWIEPPAEVKIVEGEVHVWRADLEAGFTDDFLAELAPEERGKAERFRREQDRRHFVSAHRALRRVLARYCGLEPAALRFRIGSHGKPGLAGKCGIRFNLSHSGAAALYAVCEGHEVGVDLEQIRPMPEMMEIAERVFPPQEAQALRALPPDARLRSFFRAWTRGEAYVKGTGAGLTGNDRPTGWTIRDLDVGPGYAGALAVEAERFEIRTWQYTP